MKDFPCHIWILDLSVLILFSHILIITYYVYENLSNTYSRLCMDRFLKSIGDDVNIPCQIQSLDQSVLILLSYIHVYVLHKLANTY